MSDKLKSDIASYYTSKLLEFGATAKGVDWSSEQSQELRFSQLCRIVDSSLSGASILDYGCGYGAMLGYLRRLFPSVFLVKYIGFDISKEMIDESKRNFGVGKEVTWTSNEEDLVPGDYSIASGIFNVKMHFDNELWLNYILNTLHRLNGLSRKGFSFNVLTSYSDQEFQKSNLYYADPCFFFDFCKRNFSKNVALLHDYGLYEFSILVRK